DWAMRRVCPSVALLSPTSLQAFRELYRAPVFAGGSVGDAGTPSPGAEALQVLLEQPSRGAVLQDLLRHGSPAGQLYALSGLYITDPPEFASAVAALQPGTFGRLLPRQKVRTLFGCIEGNAYFDDLVVQLKSGSLAQDIVGQEGRPEL